MDTSGKTGESSIERVSDKISVKNIAYAKVDEWCFRETVRALFDDRALKITYHSPHKVGKSVRNIQPLHLMHYDVKVISPPELKNLIKKKIEKMTKIYQDYNTV